MPQLFISNVPYDCEDAELRGWVESRGFEVESLRIVRDVVAGVSPGFGYVALRNRVPDIDAIRVLDGQSLKGRILQVKKDWRNETNRASA